MPFGIHKGKPMKDVPAEYLLFIFNNSRCTVDVALYVNRNLEALEGIVENKSKK